MANTPEVFGLHPNAEIGYYTNAAKEMWTHLVELQPQTGKQHSRPRDLEIMSYCDLEIISKRDLELFQLVYELEIVLNVAGK